MKSRHWFLPETPDIIGVLRRQTAMTIEGLDAFALWAAGDPAAAAVVADAEQRGDAVRRELRDTLRTAFITPIEPEDLFTLSRLADRILESARAVTTESEVLASPPDEGIAEMAGVLARAMRSVDDAIGHLVHDADRATAAADEALAMRKALDAAYYRGMAALLDVDVRTARIGGRELYRRCSRIGELVVDVAERVVYAVVKQS